MAITTFSRTEGQHDITLPPPSSAPVSEPPVAPAPPVAETAPLVDAGETAPASAPELADSSLETSEALGEEPGTPARSDGGFQRRIKALVTQRNAERQAREQEAREAAVLRAKVELLETQLSSRGSAPATPATPPAASAEPSGRPQLDAYDTHEAFVEALADWKAAQRIDAAFRERDAQAQQAQQQRVHATVGQRIEEGQIKYEDFDTVLANPAARIRPELLHSVVGDVVAAAPNGADVLYHLGTHPDVVAELNERTPAGAHRFLRALSAQLAAPPGNPPPASPPAPSAPPRARPPALQPLTGNAASVPIRTDAASIAEQGGSLLDYAKSRGYRE